MVKNAFWCICACFQTTRKKKILRLEWLKPFFNAFSHASRPPGKKKFFNVWSDRKRVLMHFRMLPDHQKNGLKKDVFKHLECLKTCFDALAHTPRPPDTFFQKRYFWTSGVVKNVFWCICAYFQTTRIMFLKKIFCNV